MKKGIFWSLVILFGGVLCSIENELKRLRPVIKSGGYIPGCDHGVPHDVSWENYI